MLRLEETSLVAATGIDVGLVARPLTRPLISGSDPALMGPRIALHAAVSRHVRTLAAMTPHPEHNPAFAQAWRDPARIVTSPPPDGDAAQARTFVRA